MNRELTVKLSGDAGALAEKRAAEEGFESVDAYVNTLIVEDQEAGSATWIRARLEEGIASPNTGELSRAKLVRLVDEGIARSTR